MPKFTNALQDANKLFKCSNWFGSCGRTFRADDLENINLFIEALKAVDGVEVDEPGPANKYGFITVWYTPKTNIAYAICATLLDGFAE